MEIPMGERRARAEGLYPMSKLEKGDLIEISRGQYHHWALYVGGGDVVHVTSTSKDPNAGSSSKKIVWGNRATVKRERLEDVAGNDEHRIHNHLDGQYQPRPIGDIVNEANRFVGRELPYYLTTDNCEHFVTLLRYGTPQSQQVQQVEGFVKSYFNALIAAADLFGIRATATLN